MTGINSKFGITGVIKAKVHDIDDLRSEYSSWDDMSQEEKRKAAQNVDPVETQEFTNITTNRMHEYFVDNLNPQDTSAEANLNATHIALGDGVTTESDGDPTTSTLYNNLISKDVISSAQDNGDELLLSIFLSPNEGIGDTYNEIGIFTGDPSNVGTDSSIIKLNHAVFSDISKDSTNSVTFDVSLIFSDNPN